MTRLLFLVLIGVVFSFDYAKGQQATPDTITGFKLPYEIENGDTIATGTFNNVYVFPQPVFKSKMDEMKYWRLIYNLKIVYPYAKIAGSKFAEMNQHFQTLKNDRERAEYTKQVEKDVRKQFEGQLVNLTITQGRLLIKLVDRETGKTSYDLVKELRGNFSAVFWQTMARLFGSNLKATYDSTGVDKPIEDILKAIDAGYL